MSEIVTTIVNQLNAQGVNLRGKKLVKMDNKTLRVSGGGTNVDIKYDEGNDLYNIKVHKINRKDFSVKTCESKGVFVDSLPNFFDRKIVNKMKCRRTE